MQFMIHEIWLCTSKQYQQYIKNEYMTKAKRMH